MRLSCWFRLDGQWRLERNRWNESREIKWSCIVKGAIWCLRNDIAAGAGSRVSGKTLRAQCWKQRREGVVSSGKFLGIDYLCPIGNWFWKAKNKDRFLFYFVFHNPSNGCAIFSKWLPVTREGVTTMLNSIFDQRIILMNKHSKVYYVTPILRNLHIILSKNGNRHGWDGRRLPHSLLTFFQESYPNREVASK